MPITAADWKRLSPLLDTALDLAPADRAAWIASLPAELDKHIALETEKYGKLIKDANIKME